MQYITTSKGVIQWQGRMFALVLFLAQDAEIVKLELAEVNYEGTTTVSFLVSDTEINGVVPASTNQFQTLLNQ